jgi:predicted deacylase
MLIITNFSSSPEEIAERPAVVLTGRVHPGESNASFVMEGIIDYLTAADSPEAAALRNRFVFKIVPMLNPDGVVVGNYRCSLAGADLNRQYIAPSVRSHPEIFAVKQMLRKTLESRDIFFYCDFHGHSRAKNAFMYGCNNNNAPAAKDKRLKERIFPYLLSKLTDQFNYEGCSFSI